MNTVVKIQPNDVGSIPYQEASIDIWIKSTVWPRKMARPSINRWTILISAWRARSRTWKPKKSASSGTSPSFGPCVTVPFPAGPSHLERRCAGTQTGHLHHQLHGLGHDPRFHGRYSEQGPRGRTHAQGGMRHRLRILDPASPRRLCVGRRRLYLRPAVVHGYLRQNVLHRVLRRRPPRRPDGPLSTSVIPMYWNSSAPSGRTAACGSSICPCSSPMNS